MRRGHAKRRVRGGKPDAWCSCGRDRGRDVLARPGRCVAGGCLVGFVGDVRREHPPLLDVPEADASREESVDRDHGAGGEGCVLAQRAVRGRSAAARAPLHQGQRASDRLDLDGSAERAARHGPRLGLLQERRQAHGAARDRRAAAPDRRRQAGLLAEVQLRSHAGELRRRARESLGARGRTRRLRARQLREREQRPARLGVDEPRRDSRRNAVRPRRLDLVQRGRRPSTISRS